MENLTVLPIENVLDYVETHLDAKLDLDTIAEAVHYSKYHLHRMFTSTVELTIHDYVKRRQLTEAAKLLVFSDKPIIEVAFICGYESQQAFSSIFKSNISSISYAPAVISGCNLNTSPSLICASAKVCVSKSCLPETLCINL